MPSGDIVLIEGHNVGKVRAFIGNLRWDSASRRWADKVGPMLVEAIKSEAPVMTGALRDSTQVTQVRTGNSIKLVFSAGDVPYAPYVIHGTGAHIITPDTARALHWGTDAFAAWVAHPGTRPNNYPDRAVRGKLSEIARIMGRAYRGL